MNNVITNFNKVIKKNFNTNFRVLIAFNELFINLNGKIENMNDNFDLRMTSLQSQIKYFFLRLANLNWNNNSNFPATIRATKRDEEPNNFKDVSDDGNDNPKKYNDSSEYSPSSDDQISYVGARKLFQVKISANGIVKHFRLDHKAKVVKCQEEDKLEQFDLEGIV
jgi:hypothetical protein